MRDVILFSVGVFFGANVAYIVLALLTAGRSEK